MTLFFEISGPFLWKPSLFNSTIMRRFAWGYFSFGWIKMDMGTYRDLVESGKVEWRL